MCGICGLVGPDATPERVAGMTDLLAHRGPDDVGAWHAPGVALGHRRLSIIDLSPGGHQPKLAPGGLAMTYNGEIYNYRELRDELVGLGHSFSSDSDTEVILEAYRRWDVGCLARLNGIFALALWDAPRRRLFVARDRLGVKPLYYRHDAGRFAFASEAKALVADDAPPIDPDGLANYLAFGHAVGAQTIWRGVRKLLPGHYLLLERGDLHEHPYWDVRFAPDRTMTEADAVAGVRAGLERAVRRQMVADVPVGAFLSGGVDSGAIVALMARQGGAPVKTFSVGFVDGGPAYNELAAAARIAGHVRADHHAVELRAADLPAMLDRLVWHYDEPFADAAAFPLLAVAEAASRHVKVVLTGEGGDELFGGYRRFAFERLSGYYQLAPRLLRDGVLALAQRLPRARRAKQALRAMGTPEPSARAGAWLEVFGAEARARLLRPEVLAGMSRHDPLDAYRRHHDPGRDLLANLLYIDTKTWLPDAYLEKVDKATMAVGLEARVPILDHELVELAATIPSAYKVRGRHLKVVFKKAVADLLPPDVLARPKHGFAVPTDPWFRGALRGHVADLLLGPGARSGELLRPSEVRRLLDEHASGRDVHDTRLWTILNLELWLRQPRPAMIQSAPWTTTATAAS
jgi:asparagine synthase (glutamine-hydrolysing)